jgi:hypothetical protein
MISDEIRMGMANLHDAFVNCSLLKRSMESAPLYEDVDAFHMSDRARFERLWLGGQGRWPQWCPIFGRPQILAN